MKVRVTLDETGRIVIPNVVSLSSGVKIDYNPCPQFDRWPQLRHLAGIR
jgi:hypothetical protein